MSPTSNRDIFIICPYHLFKPIPLIDTMAFRNAELWCPYCGFKTGILENSTISCDIPGLGKQLKLWQEKTADFLKANSILSASRVKFNGQFIPADQLPLEERQRLEQIVDSWKYEGSQK